MATPVRRRDPQRSRHHPEVALSATSVPDEHDPLARPDWACVLHSPPSRVGAWAPADSGYVTCQSCDQGLRERLNDVARRYLSLDPRPGGTGEHGSRGAPGFGSRPPLNLHIVCLRDPRSSIDSKIWMGRDGRVHAESERPPRSVWGSLNTVCWSIAEHRGIEGPGDRDDVFALLRWISRHIEHVARHAELVIELDAAVRALIGQLRPVTGDGRRRIGLCPATLSRAVPCRCEHFDFEHVDGKCGSPGCDCQVFLPLRSPDDADGADLVCGSALYVPTNGEDTIRCGGCGAHWDRADWLALGDLLIHAA